MHVLIYYSLLLIRIMWLAASSSTLTSSQWQTGKRNFSQVINLYPRLNLSVYFIKVTENETKIVTEYVCCFLDSVCWGACEGTTNKQQWNSRNMTGHLAKLHLIQPWRGWGLCVARNNNNKNSSKKYIADLHSANL